MNDIKDIDESGGLLADTMKELFPPRVELEREQHRLLQKLSESSGKTVRELVQQAVDRYLQEEAALRAQLSDLA